MFATPVVTAASATVAVVGTLGWRRREVSGSRRKAHALVRDGFVDVEFCTHSEKEHWWRDLSQELRSQWAKSGFPEADPNDESTWAAISKSSQMNYSLANDNIASQPDIYKDSYELQKIIVATIDPQISGRVHFGKQTHWKFQFLTSAPLVWLDQMVGGVTNQTNSGRELVLRSDKQGWRLPRFPAPSPEPKATYKNGSTWHTDQHTSHLKKTGIVPVPREGAETVAHAFGSLVAVVWYCATPGTMGPAEGATGILEDSHALVMEMYRRAGQRNMKFSVADFDAALQSFCPPCLPEESRQPLRSGNVRLIMPSLAHTVVLPQSSMAGRVRVVQNPKCWIKQHLLHLEDMDEDAPLRQFCEDPILLATTADNYGRKKRGMLQVQADQLWGKLLQARAAASSE
jgi:hypothetical protein